MRHGLLSFLHAWLTAEPADELRPPAALWRDPADELGAVGLLWLPGPPDDALGAQKCASALSGDDLVLAVKDVQKLGWLLKNGASPNDCSSNGVWTPLTLACRFDQLDAALLLLKCGANPNHCSPNGQLPLAVAAEHALPECSRLLLKYGASADLACPAHSGKSANEIVRRHGYSDVNSLVREGDRIRRYTHLLRHTHLVNACCRVLLDIYVEVTHRPNNQGCLSAQSHFDTCRLMALNINSRASSHTRV